jgi:hypothetical protein
MIDLEEEWQKMLDAIRKHIAGREFSGEITFEEAEALREMLQERTENVVGSSGWVSSSRNC